MQAIRNVSVLAIAACLAGCAAPTVSATSLPRDIAYWPTYQYSGDRNAVFKEYTIKQDWMFAGKAKINSGFALVGNTLLFTSFSHKVIALDVRNGHELWEAPLKNIAMSTPIVAGDTVFVGTGKSGLLDRNLVQKFQFFRKSVWGVPGGDEIAALDLHTGKLRWKYDTVGEDMPSAVYDRGRLIFANGDFHAYALRADTGKPVWKTDDGGISTMANAVMAGNIAVIEVCGSGTDTVALDPSTGKILWRSPYGHCDATPAYADGKIFVDDVLPGRTTLQKKTVVAALDPKTGKAIWSYHATVDGFWSSVGSDEVAVAGAYANGIYYQPAPLLDELLAFDANTGKIRWRVHTSGPAKMSPVIANGRLYIGDTAGLLYTFDARNGKILELRSFKQPFTVSPPIIAGNKLIIANETSVQAIPLSGKASFAEKTGYGLAMQ